MSGRDPIQDDACPEASMSGGAELLAPLIQGTTTVPMVGLAQATSVLIGELIAMNDEGRAPLILYPGQPGTAALGARSVVDLYEKDIGRHVVLMFESGDPRRPIVMGLLREGEKLPLNERTAQVEVDADGERVIVSAKEQLVLRCGDASITLTNAGKVLIHGAYVCTHSTGLNRIKGGSVQIN